MKQLKHIIEKRDEMESILKADIDDENPNDNIFFGSRICRPVVRTISEDSRRVGDESEVIYEDMKGGDNEYVRETYNPGDEETENTNLMENCGRQN